MKLHKWWLFNGLLFNATTLLLLLRCLQQLQRRMKQLATLTKAVINSYFSEFVRNPKTKKVATTQLEVAAIGQQHLKAPANNKQQQMAAANLTSTKTCADNGFKKRLTNSCSPSSSCSSSKSVSKDILKTHNCAKSSLVCCLSCLRLLALGLIKPCLHKCIRARTAKQEIVKLFLKLQQCCQQQLNINVSNSS